MCSASRDSCAWDDLVVLADGGRSTLRRRVDATATPTYSGFCLYRGLAPLAALGGRADGTFFLWQHGDTRLDGYAVGPALNWGVTAPAPEPPRRPKGDAPPHAYAGAGDADVDAAVARAAAAFPTPWPAAVWKSNLQPDFNVSVCDRFDARFSAVLRELDESNRYVQKSAESTLI